MGDFLSAFAESASHDVFDEEVYRAMQDVAEIAAGYSVAQQVAREVEFFFQGGAGGKLHLVATG